MLTRFDGPSAKITSNRRWMSIVVSCRILFRAGPKSFLPPPKKDTHTLIQSGHLTHKMNVDKVKLC